MTEFFGMELYQFVSFLRQVGLAVSGAASLWGILFLLIGAKKSSTDPSGVILTWIGTRMQWVIYAGGLLAIFSWLFLLSLSPASAHEGVVLITEKMQIIQAAVTMTPLYIFLISIIAFALIFRNTKHYLYNVKTGFSLFYVINFITVSILIAYYTDWTGLPASEMIFHAFHGFHSILTVGTVLVLDFMFLSSQKSPLVKKKIFPFFPQISKVIWIGLSLDLLSTLLIYPDAIVLSPRFYFAQIVVGILIVNGILLSGILTRRILSNLHEGRIKETAKWELFASIAGAISVTSWIAITFVDYFHYMTIPLYVMFLVYGAVIAGIILVREMWMIHDKRAHEFEKMYGENGEVREV